MQPARDILEPASNEQARADYLERQMQHMGSISRLPSDMSPHELVTQIKILKPQTSE